MLAIAADTAALSRGAHFAIGRHHGGCPLDKKVHDWILDICSICRDVGWEPMAETGIGMECWRWQAVTILRFVGGSETPMTKFCRWKKIGKWKGATQDKSKLYGCGARKWLLWTQASGIRMLPDFLAFNLFQEVTCAWNRLPMWHAALAVVAS